MTRYQKIELGLVASFDRSDGVETLDLRSELGTTRYDPFVVSLSNHGNA
jgi:hypothetical protein